MSGTGHSPLEETALCDVSPESAEPSDIRAALAADAASVRQRGARVCATLARDDVDRIRPVVDELGAALTDEHPGVVQTAAAALTELAAVEAAAVVGVLDRVATLVDADLGGVRLAGARLLGAVARADPAHCAPVVGALLDRLGRLPADDDRSVGASIEDRVTSRTVQQHEREERRDGRVARRLVGDVVVAVAETVPAAVADHVETVAELTTGEDVVVRGAGLDALGALCRDDPSTVKPVADAVLACLDADAAVLRARAVRTLGYLGEERYADVLRANAATEPDDEIAAVAEETAAFLDS